jgi:thiol:disulfide interchange protein DsbA
MFASIHQQGEQFTDINKLKKLFEINGISSKQFDSAITSMPVIAAERNMQDAQNKFSKAGALTGVPTFIVNDKYKVDTSKLKSQAQFNELVKYLLEK